jgi:hypothetical protein
MAKREHVCPRIFPTSGVAAEASSFPDSAVGHRNLAVERRCASAAKKVMAMPQGRRERRLLKRAMRAERFAEKARGLF